MSSPARRVPAGFLTALRSAIGPRAVVTDPALTVSHALDWTGRFRADPPVVVRPSDTDEVAAVVDAARRFGVALVPQGGNTGLAGGATPLDGEVVVDLRNLAGVTDVDHDGGQLSARAGTTLAAVQSAAAAAGWAYGVDWAARDTATIGGSVATNAGGLRHIRHGDTARQVLGVRAVLGNGEVLSHLPHVEKDNTGLRLASLLCGSEGTLGIITEVRLRLVTPPGSTATALVGFADVRSAVTAAGALRRGLSGVNAIELMLQDGLRLVREVTGLADPLGVAAPAVLLVEVEDRSDPEGTLATAVASLGGVVDAAVAVDGPRRALLWRHREEHTGAIATRGTAHKFDVTLPADALAGFVLDAPALVAAIAPDARIWLFGHAGDGNVHVNITGLSGGGAIEEAVGSAIVTEVIDRGGSIAAEHGMGRAKRRWAHLVRPPGDRAAAEAIRRVLDPDGICNPGVAGRREL